MLEKILKYLNNYFIETREYYTEIISTGIVGTFSETYIEGQYVSIENSKVNNGVYKVVSATSDTITLDATLTAENDLTGVVWGLVIPRDILNLTTEIETYNNANQKGIMSESQGNRSVSYGNSEGGGTSNWQSVFKSDLAPYKQMYSDKATWRRRWWANVPN